MNEAKTTFEDMAKDFAMSDIGLTEDEAEIALEDYEFDEN